MRVVAEYDYDDLSRRKLLTYGNDANIVYEYNTANKISELTNNLDDTNSIVFEYANYDLVGNRLSCKKDDENEQVYQYDEIYRLKFVDYNDGGNSTEYFYDNRGNRTEVDDGNSTLYDSNCMNQYTSVGATPYHYDKNGNRYKLDIEITPLEKTDRLKLFKDDLHINIKDTEQLKISCVGLY